MKTQHTIRRRLAALTIVSVLLLALNVYSENATLPYVTVYRIATLELEAVDTPTNQQARFSVESKQQGVTARDIRMVIKSGSGDIPIQLEDDGAFVLPINSDLVAENPMIVANQPKGTMRLKGFIKISGGTMNVEDEVDKEQKRVRYSFLFMQERLREDVYQQINATMPEGRALKEPKDRFCTFIPGEPNEAEIVIHSNTGDQRFLPDSQGMIRLRYDEALFEENPWVTIPPDGKLRMGKDQ